MKLTISEAARLAGVSVRTLHYYDEIGILSPSSVDVQNGYRYYNAQAIERLREIMFFRELDFPLRDIISILSSPDYDKQKALEMQRGLLLIKRERTDRLISAVDRAMKGESIMSFNEFDTTEYDNARVKYADEVRTKWGNTSAYKESEQKHSAYTDAQKSDFTSGLNDILAEFGACKSNGYAHDSAQAQALVKRWQQYITDTSYNCTNEILYGLAQMYTADERFRDNIDKNGKGTAEFMQKAIFTYVGK